MSKVHVTPLQPSISMTLSHIPYCDRFLVVPTFFVVVCLFVVLFVVFFHLWALPAALSSLSCYHLCLTSTTFITCSFPAPPAKYFGRVRGTAACEILGIDFISWGHIAPSVDCHESSIWSHPSEGNFTWPTKTGWYEKRLWDFHFQSSSCLKSSI